jgi:hypothetical protein
MGDQDVMPDFTDLDLDNDFSEPVTVKRNDDLSMEPVAIASKTVSRSR